MIKSTIDEGFKIVEANDSLCYIGVTIAAPVFLYIFIVGGISKSIKYLKA